MWNSLVRLSSSLPGVWLSVTQLVALGTSIVSWNSAHLLRARLFGQGINPF